MGNGKRGNGEWEGLGKIRITNAYSRLHENWRPKTIFAEPIIARSGEPNADTRPCREANTE